MKTYEMKDLLKKELLIIELPRKADVEIFPNSVEIYNQFTGQEESIKGSYTLLGKLDEIKEEDAEPLVHKNELGYTNYNAKTASQAVFSKFRTATQSLLSALESEIFWDVNPIEKPNGEDYYYEENHGFDGVETLWDGGSYNEDLGQFEKAELRTFDRNRTLIFVKN